MTKKVAEGKTGRQRDSRGKFVSNEEMNRLKATDAKLADVLEDVKLAEEILTGARLELIRSEHDPTWKGKMANVRIMTESLIILRRILNKRRPE